MAAEDRVITLDDFEHRLMIAGIVQYRNDVRKRNLPTEDVNALLLKLIQAPTKKKRREDRDER